MVESAIGAEAAETAQKGTNDEQDSDSRSVCGVRQSVRQRIRPQAARAVGGSAGEREQTDRADQQGFSREIAVGVYAARDNRGDDRPLDPVRTGLVTSF